MPKKRTKNKWFSHTVRVLRNSKGRFVRFKKRKKK